MLAITLPRKYALCLILLERTPDRPRNSLVANSFNGDRIDMQVQGSDGRLRTDWACSRTIKSETGGKRGQKCHAGGERMCVVVWKVGVWFKREGGGWLWSVWRKTSRVIIACVGWHIWNDHFLAQSHSLCCSWKNKETYFFACSSKLCLNGFGTLLRCWC